MKVTTYIREYEAYLKGRKQKDHTVKSKLKSLMYLDESLSGYGKADLREVSENDFVQFADFLKSKKLSPGTINHYLSSVRQFFTWLYKNDLIISSLADLVPSVKSVSTEKTIFTVVEINLFLDSIDEHLRDRVFFELLYSSGLRCSEGLKLKWSDVTMRSRKLRIEAGKGSRDRYVPYSSAAAFFLKSWKKVSPLTDENYLFPGAFGGHLTYGCIGQRFRKYLLISGIDKKGLTIHSIRHSTATHLLEAGANVRYVSELLGHKSMETTVKYTHPTVESMRKTYRMYHPRENGYYKEIDTAYEAELAALKDKFADRAAFLDKYCKKG